MILLQQSLQNLPRLQDNSILVSVPGATLSEASATLLYVILNLYTISLLVSSWTSRCKKLSSALFCASPGCDAQTVAKFLWEMLVALSLPQSVDPGAQLPGVCLCGTWKFSTGAKISLLQDGDKHWALWHILPAGRGGLLSWLQSSPDAMVLFNEVSLS